MIEVEAKSKTLQFSTLVEPDSDNVCWLVGWSAFFSKMALRIFLKLGTKLDIDNCDKLTKPDYSKKLRIIQKVRKCGQIDGFLTFSQKLL